MATGAARVASYVTQDDDLDRLGSQVVEDLGEVNMADGQTLVDFVKWAMENYPADKYALILSDHGMGWPGGWSDPDPGGSGDRSIPFSRCAGQPALSQRARRCPGPDPAGDRPG